MIPSPKLPQNHVLGCLLGTAVGDSLGLPAEGMSRHAIKKRWGKLNRQRLVFGKGMFSDDTEHSLMVAAALIRHPDDVKRFQNCFAWSLRWWFLALPPGVGLGTARAILWLWLDYRLCCPGVHSAGNGAAMRSAVIGAAFPDDPEKRRAFTKAAAWLTHIDKRAVEAAVLTAEAAALAARGADNAECLRRLRDHTDTPEMRKRWRQLEAGLAQGECVSAFAGNIGCGEGVSGFAPNTVAVALYAWLRHRGDFARILQEVIACGGDTDTVAAIAGGVAGAEAGEAGIPEEWIANIRDWPRSVSYVRRMAAALTERLAGDPATPPRLSAPFVPFRNLLFLLIVLAHGFRRLLPV